MSEIIFPEGINYYPPNPQAPDFVKGTLVLKPKELTQFMKQYEGTDGVVRLDMLVSKKTEKIYLKLNTFNNHKEPPANPEPVNDVKPSGDLNIPF